MHRLVFSGTTTHWIIAGHPVLFSLSVLQLAHGRTLLFRSNIFSSLCGMTLHRIYVWYRMGCIHTSLGHACGRRCGTILTTPLLGDATSVQEHVMGWQEDTACECGRHLLARRLCICEHESDSPQTVFAKR